MMVSARCVSQVVEFGFCSFTLQLLELVYSFNTESIEIGFDGPDGHLVGR
jgi:hypothetical protein